MQPKLTVQRITTNRINFASTIGPWAAAHKRKQRNNKFINLMTHCKAVHGSHHPSKDCQACKEIMER